MNTNIGKDTIIAVDFDNTLCRSQFPECGEPIKPVIHFVQKCKSAGAIIILWTCREGESLQKAIDWCKDNEVPIDYVNENVPERIEKWGNDCRKIGADYYIDDRCIGLNEIVDDMEDIK